jgi:hypothetical protein
MEEAFSDAERRRLLDLCMAAVPHDRGDDQLTGLISRLSGVDTVLMVRRAYPSRDNSPGFLSKLALSLLQQDICPDCHRWGMVTGPKGGICTNEACRNCGAEFNVGRVAGSVVMAHPNPPQGGIDRVRLREVYGIVLPEDE